FLPPTRRRHHNGNASCGLDVLHLTSMTPSASMRPPMARHTRRFSMAAAAVLVGLFGWFFRTDPVAAEPQTLVVFNGEAVPVYFNDGDTFRLLQGRYSGASARLAGFNTL